MPWNEISPMDERCQFVADVRRAHESMTALCDRYGISRKTGYKCPSARGGADAGCDRHDRRQAHEPRKSFQHLPLGTMPVAA